MFKSLRCFSAGIGIIWTRLVDWSIALHIDGSCRFLVVKLHQDVCFPFCSRQLGHLRPLRIVLSSSVAVSLASKLDIP